MYSQVFVARGWGGGWSLYDVTSCLPGWSHGLSNGGCLPTGALTREGSASEPVGQNPPSPPPAPLRHQKAGRYASYWNAFLFHDTDGDITNLPMQWVFPKCAKSTASAAEMSVTIDFTFSKHDSLIKNILNYYEFDIFIIALTITI